MQQSCVKYWMLLLHLLKSQIQYFSTSFNWLVPSGDRFILSQKGWFSQRPRQPESNKEPKKIHSQGLGLEVKTVGSTKDLVSPQSEENASGTTSILPGHLLGSPRYLWKYAMAGTCDHRERGDIYQSKTIQEWARISKNLSFCGFSNIKQIFMWVVASLLLMSSWI